MTVKELREYLRDVDDNRIITIERPGDDRSDERCLDPTGEIEIEPLDNYFVIMTN